MSDLKILGISGSPRKGRNTDYCVKEALKVVEEEGLEPQFLSLADKEIKPCTSCWVCQERKECNIRDDMDEIIPKLEESAGIIIASPVYMGLMSASLRAMMERALVTRMRDFSLHNKVGGAIAVGGGRNGGQEYTIHGIHNWFMQVDMIVVGDGKPGGHYGGAVWLAGKGAEHDEDGLRTVRSVARRVVGVAKLIWGNR